MDVARKRGFMCFYLDILEMCSDDRRFGDRGTDSYKDMIYVFPPLNANCKYVLYIIHLNLKLLSSPCDRTETALSSKEIEELLSNHFM